MKKFVQTVRFSLVIGLTVIAVLAVGASAMAADGPATWRPTYDIILRWINFIILAAVMFKYLRQPFKNFLDGSKDKVASEIERVEAQKAEAEEKIRLARKAIDESDKRLEEIKKRLIEHGQMAKQAMIEEAKQQSRQMIFEAHHRATSQMQHAREGFRAELVDAAVDIAAKELPQLVGAQDNQRLLNDFIAHIEE